jgi:hypothetical protein
MEWGLCPGPFYPTCILEGGTSLPRTITKPSEANGATGQVPPASAKEGAR